MGCFSMIITKQNRESHLRSKNRFYVAGWVAAEFDEKPQVKPDGFEQQAAVDEMHFDYMEGFNECQKCTSVNSSSFFCCSGEYQWLV